MVLDEGQIDTYYETHVISSWKLDIVVNLCHVWLVLSCSDKLMVIGLSDYNQHVISVNLILCLFIIKVSYLRHLCSHHSIIFTKVQDLA